MPIAIPQTNHEGFTMRLTTIIGAGLGVILTTSLGMNILQYYKTDKQSFLNEVNRDRSRINQDALNEVLLGYMEGLRNNTVENAKQTGKLEGILSVAYRAAPQENEYSAVWHGGYERGLEQSKFVGELEYEKGYAAGLTKGRADYLQSINNILESKEDFKTALREFINSQNKIADNQQKQEVIKTTPEKK
jgi:hypothetical protein